MESGYRVWVLPCQTLSHCQMTIDSQKREQFESCVRDCADSIYRVAYRLSGNETLARELVQETYLNAWKSLDRLSDPAKTRSWMFAILRNQFSKLIRKESKAVVTSVEFDEPVEKELPDTETQEAVQNAVQSLDEAHRLPILLVSMEGMSVEEAAEILELPKGTVLSRLHRARQKLKETLSRDLMKA